MVRSRICAERIGANVPGSSARIFRLRRRRLRIHLPLGSLSSAWRRPGGTHGRRSSGKPRSDTVIGRAGEEELLLVHFDVDKIREFQRAEFWRVDYRHHDHEITLTYNACALKSDSPIGYGNASPGPGFRPRASRGCIVWLPHVDIPCGWGYQGRIGASGDSLASLEFGEAPIG